VPSSFADAEPDAAPVPAPGMARGRHYLIVNPTAGTVKQRRLDRAFRRLAERGVEIVVRETTRRGDAEDFAREAARNDPNAAAVIAAGGDGTINEVANGLIAGRAGSAQAGSGPALGVIPLGTANVLAAELGLPSDPVGAADAIALGARRTIHLGLCNERYFLMMCGVGFDARVVAAVRPAVKRQLGKGAYVLETLAEMLRHPGTRYQVEIDGAIQDAASAIVANGHFYAGRFVVAPDARLDDPGLDVCVFPGGRRIDAMRYATALTLGRLQRQPDLSLRPGRLIVVDGPVGDPIQGDGDTIGHLPARIIAGAATLDVLAPS
jgi:diacylglycerol kinase (ATP)